MDGMALKGPLLKAFGHGQWVMEQLSLYGDRRKEKED